MDDLDALLADLQTTTSHLKTGGGGGGLDSDHAHHYSYTEDFNNLQPIPTDIHKYQKEDPGITSPSRNMKEVTTITTTTTTYRQHPTGPSPALDSNLSELDTLLEDLSTSKYNSYADKRQVPESPKSPRSPSSTNGPAANRYRSLSPTGSSGSGGLQDSRPTVESLLDELQSAVPGGGSGKPRNPERQTGIVMNTRTVQQSVPLSPTTGRPNQAPSASSATRELDDLMASLSDFKVSSAPAPSQATISADSLYAKPNKPKTSGQPGGQQPLSNNHLESMLGTLQSDMSRQGINTAQKGCCAACNKPIVGQVVTALAKTWHPEHFTCAHCRQELGTKNFFERDGQPYCEKDYHNLFSPRCAYCNGPILDKCVSALDKTWHPEHFFCAQCGNQFGEDGFHEKEGKPYCKNDYFEMFAPKCGGCSRPIMENYISALNTQWHPECFVCRDCKSQLQGGSFYAMDKKPVCAKCCGVDDEGEEED